MSSHLTTPVIAAFAALAVAAPLSAQARSTIDPNTLEAAVVSHAVQSRAFVTSTLTSRNARSVAANMGLSPDAVAARVATLDDASVQKVADQILAGGDSRIVISTTAIIIGLLLLILLTR